MGGQGAELRAANPPAASTSQLFFTWQLPARERWWLLNEKQMELSLVKVDSHNNKELSSNHPALLGLKNVMRLFSINHFHKIRSLAIQHGSQSVYTVNFLALSTTPLL